MGAHFPEPAEPGRGHSKAEHPNISFEKCAHEVLAPLKTDLVSGGKIAPGKTTPQPETSKTIRLFRFNFSEQKRRQVEIGNSSGQGFRALADQIASGRAKNQKLAVSAAFIHNASKGCKQLRDALYLVQADQIVFVQAEKGQRVIQFG